MKQIIALLTSFLFVAAANAWEVDNENTEFKWTGKKVTGQHYGKVPLKTSKISTEKDKITGGEFVIDISNMTVEDLKGKDASKFLGHMKSEDFFEVEKWPTAKLVINKLDGKMAHGELTIKDKTEKVSFPYSKKDKTYTGTLKFDRTKYGMVYGSGDFFKGLGDKMIYNDVTLDFRVTLKGGKKLAQQGR